MNKEPPERGVTGFITIGLQTYEMLEVTEAEMDKLIVSGDRQFDWPYRYDQRKRVWPKPRPGMEVFFHD